MKIKLFMLSTVFWTASAHATQFYINPQTGSIHNTGAVNSPWRTLQEVLENHLVQSNNLSGQVVNANAPIKAGDTLVLLSGYHGDVIIENAYNSAYIKITAAQGNTPVLSSLRIDAAKKWQLTNLRIKAYQHPASIIPQNYMVKIGTVNKLGASSDIQFSNSVIETAEGIEATWSAIELSQNTLNGLFIGQYAHNVVASNNYIANVSMGINVSAPTSLIAGNVITRYAKDGIRISSDGVIVQDNIISNNLKVDANHDDAIQGYNAVGLANVLINNNIILEREPNSRLRFAGPLQGVGFFDGPVNNINVQDNMIQISGYHGVSLYDAKHCLIAGNTVLGFNGNKARIVLGSKAKGGVNSNKVENNNAQLFDLTLDADIVAFNNHITDMNNTAGFFTELSNRVQAINQKYGLLGYGKKRLSF